MPKNLPCTSATKYKKHSAGKPLHERKTTLEIPVQFASILAVAEQHKVSLKDAERIMKIALQRHWVEYQQSILDDALQNGHTHSFQYQPEQAPKVDYDPTKYL